MEIFRKKIIKLRGFSEKKQVTIDNPKFEQICMVSGFDADRTNALRNKTL